MACDQAKHVYIAISLQNYQLFEAFYYVLAPCTVKGEYKLFNSRSHQAVETLCGNERKSIMIWSNGQQFVVFLLCKLVDLSL